LAVLLLLIAVGLLAPIWTVRYPPLVDYPNHLASAFVLAHLNDPAFHFSQFYASDWNTYPYLAMDLILVGLQHLMPIDWAGRVLLSLSILAVPAAAWFFVRQANPEEESLAFWSLLISNNVFFFVYGFLNMQLSLALCLLLVGLWLRWLERSGKGESGQKADGATSKGRAAPHFPFSRFSVSPFGHWCLLLVLTTALYFTHLMGFGMAGLVTTAYAALARRRIREITLTWLLFVPGAAFFLHSWIHQASGPVVVFQGFTGKLTDLLAVIVGCSPALDFLTVLVMGASAVLAQLDNPNFKWNYKWLGVAGCLFALYWLLPSAYGAGSDRDRRVLPFLFLVSLATVRVGRRARLLGAVAVILFFVRAGTLERHFISVQPEYSALAQSLSAIPGSARVLPVLEWRKVSSDPEHHFWAYGVIERGWFVPCLFHDPGVHPFRIKLETYAPCGPDFIPKGSLDWGRVQSDFDYVWAYRVPQLSSSLFAIGTLVSQQDDVQVFHLRHFPSP
jgi:hypothetical protein